MEITKTIIVIGREGNLEHYALLAGKQIISCSYNPTKGNHDEFVRNVAKDFALAYCLLAKRVGINEVGILNGYKLSNGELKGVSKLENTKMLASEFSEIIKSSVGRNEEVILPSNFN
jgi:hypothetical protein